MMKPIQMVDLQTQYQKIKPEIDNAIAEVINTTSFIKGKQVVDFEQSLAKYLNVKHVISCANGTDALQIALMACDFEPGSEIITPSFTFIATAEVIALLGLKPVFAEVDPHTFTINPESVKKLITPKTRAIIPVHLFGQCADMAGLLRLADKHKLAIIEDTAQAMGANYFFPCGTPHKAGTIGKIGCTSFFPSKNLGCFGDGGAMYTNDDILAEKMRLLCNHGMKVRYHHDVIGVNSRLDAIQAAILNVKLNYLDEYNVARNKAAEYYNNAFSQIKEIETPKCEKYTTHVFHQYTIKVSPTHRDNLKKYLEEKHIPAMVYYPIPLHLQQAFIKTNFAKDKLDITEILSKTVISLPMHTELDNEQLEYITESVKSYFKTS